MVDLESRLNSLRVNRLRRLDFPTPESPIKTTVGSRCQQQEIASFGPGICWQGRNDGTFEEELQRGPLVSNWQDIRAT